MLTFAVGNSAETLWLYVLGLSAKVLGPSVLALVLPSALAAAATAWLTARFVVARRPETPWEIPFLLAAGSPWLFHYGRSGFRAITAPLGLALAALLLQRGEARPGRIWPYAFAGGVVGLSLYGYTAARLLPLALAAAFVVLLVRDRAGRPARTRAALAAAAGFAAVSIPNAVFLVRHPVEFFVRGGYSVIGDAPGRLRNVLATLALPLDYPDRYRFVWGDAHVLDAYGASMTGSGVDPVPLLAGLLAVVGLVLTLRRARDLVALFLVATHVLAVLFLGPLGPSLTRLLLLVPCSCSTRPRSPRVRENAGARLAAGVLLSSSRSLSHGYVSRLSDPGRRAREYVGEAQTAMGERARPRGERRRLAVVSDDAGVLRALAFGAPRRSSSSAGGRSTCARSRPSSPRTLLVEAYPSSIPGVRPASSRSSPDPRWHEWTPVGGGPVSRAGAAARASRSAPGRARTQGSFSSASAASRTGSSTTPPRRCSRGSRSSRATGSR